MSEVYFALDPDTGIASHPQHDPWRWAQDVSDRIGTSDESFVVFLAAPPPAMGLTIYKDLQNNQAFVAAKYLKNMVSGDEHFSSSSKFELIYTTTVFPFKRLTRIAWQSSTSPTPTLQPSPPWSRPT